MQQQSKPALAYQTLGDGSKPALMLLHGFMSSNAQWLMNTQALSREYFLVMVELWGHGDSPTPNDPSHYSVDAYIDQFETIRRNLSIEHWALIGQSYGAGLVINYAIVHPEQVVKVVVTNSRSAFGQLVSKQGRAPSTAGAQQRREITDLRNLPYHPVNARRFPAHVKQALVQKADAMTPEAIHLGGLLGETLNCTQRLHELNMPLLLTNGVFEKSFQSDLQALVAHYPDLNVADLEGGHSVNIEAAEGFNRAVLGFLAGGSHA